MDKAVIESPISLWADYIGVKDETIEKQDDDRSFSPDKMVSIDEVTKEIGTPRAVRFHATTFSFVIEDEGGRSIGFPVQDLTRIEKRVVATELLAELRRRVSGDDDAPDFYA